MLSHPKHGENDTGFDQECMIVFMILSTTEANWRSYINYLELEIDRLVSRISTYGGVVCVADTLPCMPG